jgi:hypothetical protein
LILPLISSGRSAFICLMNAFGTRGLILPTADAVVPEFEDGVHAALELAASSRTRAVRKTAVVDPLHGARQDVRAEVRLVLVHADAPAALLARSVERAEAATAGDLEDHPRALRDLVERELLALVLRDEVLRERDQDLLPWTQRLRRPGTPR